MSCASSNARRRWLGCAGTTSLEMALVMVAFMTLLLGATDVARYIVTIQSMDYLAGKAIRAAILPTSSSGYLAPQACTLLSSSSLPFSTPPFLESSGKLCVVLSTDATTGATTMTVTVQSPFTTYTPGMSALTTPSGSPLSVTTELKY